MSWLLLSVNITFTQLCEYLIRNSKCILYNVKPQQAVHSIAVFC